MLSFKVDASFQHGAAVLPATLAEGRRVHSSLGFSLGDDDQSALTGREVANLRFNSGLPQKSAGNLGERQVDTVHVAVGLGNNNAHMIWWIRAETWCR